MEQDDFDELAGRIEGVSTVLLHLIADLEMREIMDGPRFTQGMRRAAEQLQFPQPHLEPTKRTLLEMASALDAARKNRQEAGNSGGNHIDH